MINNDNSYIPKDDDKGMLETMKDIIRNKKKIKVHDNEFDFSGLENVVFDNGDNNYAYGKIKINGTEIYVNVEIVKNINYSGNEEYKKFSYFGIYFNDTDLNKDVKINYNGKVFNVNRRMCLNSDFSVHSLECNPRYDKNGKLKPVFCPIVPYVPATSYYLNNYNSYVLNKTSNEIISNNQTTSLTFIGNETSQRTTMIDENAYKSISKLADEAIYSKIKYFKGRVKRRNIKIVSNDKYVVIYNYQDIKVYEKNNANGKYKFVSKRDVPRPVLLKKVDFDNSEMFIKNNKLCTRLKQDNSQVLETYELPNLTKITTIKDKDKTINTGNLDNFDFNELRTYDDFDHLLKRHFDKCVIEQKENDIKKSKYNHKFYEINQCKEVQNKTFVSHNFGSSSIQK